MGKIVFSALAAAAMLAAPQLSAQVTHTGDDLVAAGLTPTPAFGAVQGVVGTRAIAFGVDYSYGNAEGVFTDPPYKLCGIVGGTCTLTGAVDGRIVQLGTTTQGLTSSLSVLAGFTSPNALTLSIFGISGNLLGTTSGVGGDSGPYSFTRSSADIAFFSISGNDTFGVESVTIGTPVAAGGIPEPASWAMMIGGFGLAGGALRRRRAGARIAPALA